MHWLFSDVKDFVTKVVKFLVWAYFIKNKVDKASLLVKENVFL